jgi:uncharacterized membrane protein
MAVARGLVLVTLVACAAVAPAVGVGQETGAAQASVAGTQVDADDVLLAADIRADGSAEWRIEYRVQLDDENTTEAFDSLQQDIRNDPENYTQTFAGRMRTTADAAEESTGREMGIQNVTVTAERQQLPREYGVVTYRFNWTGFAVVEGSQLQIGDAIEGMFLDSATTLLVSWPETYQVSSVDPSPDDRSENSASWTGPREFTAEQPLVVLTAQSTSATPGVLSLALLGVVVLVALSGVVWYRRGGRLPWAGPRADNGVADPSEGATGSEETERGAGEESVSETGAATATSPADATDADRQEVPAELLSNEERVLKLLENRGGRMKQQAVVQKLDWTEAKTSQVVSTLREEGKVETFRIGRENVLAVPDEDS